MASWKWLRHAVASASAGVLVLLGALGPPGPVHASTIEVFPGPNAISNAIASAKAGDTIKVHAGKYFDPIMIGKRVKLVKFGDGAVILKGDCRFDTAMIDIRADNVTVKGMTVKGAAFYAITVTGFDNATIKGNRVFNTCGPGAEYGINVFDGGSAQVLNNRAQGWFDAGIYIGGITSTPNGALLVKGNTLDKGNRRGIIVEDSSGVDIEVRENSISGNTVTGILLNNVDDVVIDSNIITDNSTTGVDIGSTSDDNRITGNTISGHTLDIDNDNGGTGNCFLNNTFTTSSGNTSNVCT